MAQDLKRMLGELGLRADKFVNLPANMGLTPELAIIMKMTDEGYFDEPTK